MTNTKEPVIVKCFCDEGDGTGNPAGIYIDQLINDEQKQRIASELNLPVTVFVTSASCDIPSIEFFYPNRKMPLCLHGTLAAAHVLFGKSELGAMSIRTSDRKILRINKAASNHFEVEVISEQVEQPSFSALTISQLLNIDVSNISNDLPFTVASVGSPKLLIPIFSQDKLAELKPNYSEIEGWSLASGVNGIYVYCYDAAEDLYHSRGFNPMTGHNEDAATGVAAAALSSQLARDIVVKQGQVLGHLCRINIRFVSLGSIWVGGVTRNADQ